MKVFTIGYGGRKPEDFLNILKKNGIRAVVDVRLRPDRASMGVYAKAKSTDRGIDKLLGSSKIQYYSMPELGNVFLDLDDWRERYKKLLESCGEVLLDRLYNIDVPKPFCLLCAEKKSSQCHRKEIADYLVAWKGWQVEHL